MSQPTWEGPIPTSGRQRRVVLAPVLGLIALGICGLVVLGLVASSVGGAGVVVGAVCALVPVALVVTAVLWVDRWEPEPPRLLLLAFLWGACFAALSALVINSSAALIADEVLGRGSGDVVGAVAVAPIVEEAVKGVFLVGLLIFRRREFDGIVDGIVYAGLVAAGFAFTENILYFGRAFTEDGPIGPAGGVFALLVMRGLLSPFAHPLFTAMTGIGAGIASNSRNPIVRVTAVLIGYVLAVTLHALWNGSASLQGGEAFLGVYGFIMVPLFLAMIAIVIWQRRREQRIVIEQLPGFAQAGWIAPSEIALLSSLAGRRGWRAAVRRRSGKRVAKAVTDYQAAVTDLAFLRSRMSRGSVGGETGVFWHGEALSELARARDRAIGHPEALTMALRHHGAPAAPSWTPPPPGPPPTPPPGPPPGPGGAPGFPAPPGWPGSGPPPSWPDGGPGRPDGRSWPAGPPPHPPGPPPPGPPPPGRPGGPPGRPGGPQPGRPEAAPAGPIPPQPGGRPEPGPPGSRAESGTPGGRQESGSLGSRPESGSPGRRFEPGPRSESGSPGWRPEPGSRPESGPPGARHEPGPPGSHRARNEPPADRFPDEPTRRITARRPAEPPVGRGPSAPADHSGAGSTADDDSPTTRR